MLGLLGPIYTLYDPYITNSNPSLNLAADKLDKPSSRIFAKMSYPEGPVPKN